MWEGLIILGLAALGSVTVITVKALEFAKLLEKKGSKLPLEKDRETARADEFEKEAAELFKKGQYSAASGLRDLADAARERAAKL